MNGCLGFPPKALKKTEFKREIYKDTFDMVDDAMPNRGSYLRLLLHVRLSPKPNTVKRSRL
jgi:hypothetical protein